MAEILTRAEMLTYLGLAQSAPASALNLLNLVQGEVESAIEDYLGWPVPSDTRTEYLPESVEDFVWDDFTDAPLQPDAGPWRETGRTNALRLSAKYVTAVSGVWLNEEGWFADAAFTNSFLMAANTYRWSPDGFLFPTTFFPARPGSVKVTYTSGLTPAQLESRKFRGIKLATKLAVADAFKVAMQDQVQASKGVSGPVTRERWPDHQVEYMTGNVGVAPYARNAVVTPRVTELLDRFVRHLR